MKFLAILFLLMGTITFAQEEKVKKKELAESKNMTWEGNKNLANNDFIEAEVEYRKAISKSGENAAAPYNLGNAYYNNETYAEAFGRYKEAGELATKKNDKHKAYHNMGNVFMKRKEYEKAVEAYKEALRNNPTDEETRYNLALAKEMLKKQQEQQKKDQNKDDKDKDKKDEKKDNKEGDNKDENKDSQKEGDKGDEKKDKDENGKGDKKEEEQKQPEKGENKKEQKQPRPNQLSKQQIQNLLEAMQNEEKKVQQKIDAKKVKGVKIKNEKDW
jgi:tetratricopeptide (TPR) repeat protein